jgi:hypothetical protein
MAARRGAAAHAEGARRKSGRAAPPARRDAARLPRRGALPHPPAEAGGRRGARLRRRGHVRRAARHGLCFHRLGVGELLCASHDARHVSAEGAGRDLGRLARRADRLVVRVPGGEGEESEGRLRGLRALAVLERRVSVGMEHARRARLPRRQRAARAARVPAAQVAVQGDRQLVRGRAARHRQHGLRGQGAVRARVPHARGRRHQGRADARQRSEPRPALPDAGVRAFPLHAPACRSASRRGSSTASVPRPAA